MSQLMEQEGGSRQFSDEDLASLLKRTLENDFRLTESETFGSVLDKKRRLKRKKTPEYRRIKRYFKSIKQYWKERKRRKQVLHLWMVEFRSQKYMAEKLGVSVSTIKRDVAKLRRFVRGQTNRAIRTMKDEWRQKREQAIEGLSLRERFDYLSLELERQKKLWQQRGYRGHYTIFHIDMTQPGPYGLPKLTILPRQTRGKQLAYPHKMRVHVKMKYEDKILEADLGGFSIIKTTIR